MCTALCTQRLALQPESTERTLSFSGPHAIQADFYVIQCINQSSILRCGICCLQIPKRAIRHYAASIMATDARCSNVLGSLLVCPGMAITIQALYIVQKSQAPESFYVFHPNFWSTCAYQGLKYYIMFFLLWDN